MAAVVQKELISKIRSRSENQIPSIENVSPIGKPPLPAKKGRVTRQPSNPGWNTCPPKPPPYREHVSKKKSDGETSSEPLTQKESPASTPDKGLPSPNGLQVYAPALPPKLTSPSSEGSATITCQNFSYDQNGTMRRTDTHGGGAANKPHPLAPTGPRSSPPENEMKLEKPPQPPVGAPEKPPYAEKGRIPRESLRNVQGIKSLISQFDGQKNPSEVTPVTSGPAPPKPPRATSNITDRDKIPHLVKIVNGKSESKPPMARKSSAPAQLEKIPQILSALQQQEQLEPLSENGEEAVPPPANSGTKRPPWGVVAHGNKVHLPGVHHQKQLVMQGSQDSGFCSDVEGGGSHPTPPTHTEEGTGQITTESVPVTRFGLETREEKLRRSARRRGLFSDGHLMEQDNVPKRVPLNDRSSLYEVATSDSNSHNEGFRTLDSQVSESSNGYLKVLPGQAIPPAPSAQQGKAQADKQQGTLSEFPEELNAFMKAIHGKEGKEKKAHGERRKHHKVIRNMSDPMLKALKVALDEEASRREPSNSNVDTTVNAKRVGNNGKKADRRDSPDGSPTSPPIASRGKSLVAKVTRLVRGKKEEVAPKRSLASSSLHNKSNRGVIGKSTGSESVAIEHTQGSKLPVISDPHRKVWQNRMDLCLPPPVPPRQYSQDEIYEYVKMPFRRNVRVSVKYAGLQALKTVPMVSTTAAGPKQLTESEGSPPPIYPKSRSIKRSILLNQGRDVTLITDWNKSVADLLDDSYSPGTTRKHVRSSSDEVITCSTFQQVAEGVFPHAEESSFQLSTSYPENISDELQDGGYDPYYLMLSKPSLKQRLLSTSVEVLFQIHEQAPALSASVKSVNPAQGKSLTLPTSMRYTHQYENFGDVFRAVNPRDEGLTAGTKSTDCMSDDYIKMQREDFPGLNRKKDFPRRKSDGGFFPGVKKAEKKEQRYMNIWEAVDAIKEDPEEDGIPDYIRMHAPSSLEGELAPPLPDRQLSTEDYIWCQRRRDSTIAKEEYFARNSGEEQEGSEEAKNTKNSYMNWMDIIDDFFPNAKDTEAQLQKKEATERDDRHDPASPSQMSPRSVAIDRSDAPPLRQPKPLFSIYSTLLPEGEGGEGVEEADVGYDEREEYVAQKRESFIIKTTDDEEDASKGGRYMNIADAELILSADSPTGRQRPSIADKVPMPSPRKASLSRRRPLNVLHPEIRFDELPVELKETNLQCQRRSITSIYSVSPGEPPISPGNPPQPTLPNGLCVICSAYEEFTHMGGVLKPKEECGIYIEVPKDAVKKNSTQKLWFIACYDTQYPGTSWQKAGTLSRNTSDEIQLLDQDRDMKATTVSPLVYVGPSTADLVKPLRIHLPHCISFQESSMKCWLEAKCYEMPRWAVVCQRSFFHTPPKSKEFNDPSYKPNILFQMAPSSATIKTCHMGWFRIGASAFRGASKAAKHMFAGIFQRLPNDFNPTLNTISEEGGEETMFSEQKKDGNSKNELLVVIANSLPYVGEVIQWLLEKGINKYVCLERYMPFKYCANGRDLEVILYGESSRAPIQTTSVPFGNLWRMRHIGEGWQTLTVRSPEKYQEQTLTFQLKQGDFPKQYSRNIRMHDGNDSKA